MAVVESYDWESGLSSGTAMTPANSGLNLATGWTYSNAQLLTNGGGALSGRTTASAGTTFLNGLSAFTAEAEVWVRFYLYVVTAPASTTTLMQLRSGSTMRCELRLSSSGGIQLRNSSSTQVLAPVASTVPTGAWVRVEWRYSNTAGQQQVRVFTGANVHGTTADYDSGNVTTTAAGTVDGWQLGILNSATMTMHVDELVIDDATWPGPSYVANVAPTANAGADQTGKNAGDTVTLSGSDSDTDGTVVTRAWTQLSGTSVTLSGASTATATFTAPTLGATETLVFQYEVTDDDGATDADTCSVEVLVYVDPDDGGLRIYVVSDAGVKQECDGYAVSDAGVKQQFADRSV